jgi:hypothetical protein
MNNVIPITAARARRTGQRASDMRPRRVCRDAGPFARPLQMAAQLAVHPKVRGNCACGTELRGDRPCWVTWFADGSIVASCAHCGAAYREATP